MSEKKTLKFPDINDPKYNFRDIEGCYTQEDELDSYKLYVRDIINFKEGLVAELEKDYNNIKLHTELDEKSGYPISQDRKDLLKLYEKVLARLGVEKKETE